MREMNRRCSKWPECALCSGVQCAVAMCWSIGQGGGGGRWGEGTYQDSFLLSFGKRCTPTNISLYAVVGGRSMWAGATLRLFPPLSVWLVHSCTMLKHWNERSYGNLADSIVAIIFMQYPLSGLNFHLFPLFSSPFPIFTPNKPPTS